MTDEKKPGGETRRPSDTLEIDKALIEEELRKMREESPEEPKVASEPPPSSSPLVDESPTSPQSPGAKGPICPTCEGHTTVAEFISFGRYATRRCPTCQGKGRFPAP